MENMTKLNLKKRLTMRGYQETIVIDIMSKFNIGKPYVLGSCPSSGKTEMAIETIIRLLETGQVNRVLILAHSTNVLKENFYNRLMEYFNDDEVEIMRGQKNYNYDARIQVMIPQNIAHIIGKFDLIVTDEAHHNVLAEEGNYSRIVDQVEPKFQLLLTGTPSKFVRENNLAEDQNNLPYHINTVGMDMVGFEYFHNVRFDLIRSAYGFTSADYNQNQDISSDTKFSLAETERTINNVIIGAVRNIALRNGVILPKTADCVLEGRKLIQKGKFGKTLIMCRSIEQANQVQEVISKLFKVQVKVSQSKNDGDSLNLTKFKEGKFDFLCVVNRAREGYDDKKIVNLIDVTMTHNIDLIYQMFCRVVRKDDTNPNPKLYLKVTSNAEGMPEYTMNIMTAALMLGATENLSMFNGSNFRGIVMPRVERDEPTEEVEDEPIVSGVVGEVDTEGNVIRRRNISNLMVLDLIKMFSEDHENLVNGNDRYAMTTLGESLDILNPKFDVNTIEQCVELGIKHGITSGLNWSAKYKEIGVKESLILPSVPWKVFNLEGGISEFSKMLGSDKYLYDVSLAEECVELGKKYGVKTSGQWCDNYIEISKKENLKLPSNPWNVFKLEGGEKEFSRLLGLNNSNYLSNDEHFDICVKNKLTTHKKYCDYLLKNPNIKLRTQPWFSVNKKQKEYFDEIKKQTNDIYLNLDDHIVICVSNQLTSLDIYYNFKRQNPNIKLYSNPWKHKKQTQSEFFTNIRQLLGVNKTYDVNSIEECIFLGKKYNLRSGEQWVKNREKISETEGKSLPSVPWKTFGLEGGEKEFGRLLKISDSTKEYKPAYLGEFSEMNKAWNTSNSNSNHKRLKKDPTEWFKYHKLYSKARAKWSEIPYVEISKKIKDRPEWVVGDFGCGENLLRKELKNKVHSFDHVAIDDTVVSCDLTDIPLHNDVLDVVVFSLSLMHTNYDEYLKEAYRVLKPYGNVFIAEPRQRWSDEEGNLDEERVKKVLTDAGFKLAGDVKVTERFIYIDAIKY